VNFENFWAKIQISPPPKKNNYHPPTVKPTQEMAGIHQPENRLANQVLQALNGENRIRIRP
jgi:hypothetical protein